jgi:AcrR family transcriptional regulator
MISCSCTANDSSSTTSYALVTSDGEVNVDRSRRRDAVETRERILRAAADAFTGHCRSLSFDEIADRAGVSRATVYRHFPDRQALGAAITARGIGALKRATADDMAFRDLLHTVLATAVAMRRLGELIEALPDRERNRHVRALVDQLTPAFRRAQTAGELRADVEPGDLALMLRALLAAARGPDGEAAAKRLLAVLMDGLFGPGGSAPACVWTVEATSR